MPFGVQPEVQCDGPRLAAAPGATIADDIGSALDEGCLRSRLRFDNLNVHPWSALVLDQFAVSAVGEAGTAATILRLPILKAHLGGGVYIGGWFSQGMLDLHLLPIDHEPEELCLHRRGLNRRRHLIDPERVGPVLIELPGKAVDGHLMAGPP